MRREDLRDYASLRGVVSNPWQVVRFRKTQKAGQTLQVRMRTRPDLLLRGGRNDHHMFHRIFLRDEYRLAGLRFDSASTVVDLGANVGIFSARVAGLAERVIAYEPARENFDQLNRNIAELSNVVAVARAVSGTSGVLRLYRPAAAQLTGAYSAFQEMGGHMSEEFDEVDTVTLDELFAEHRIETCELLKVDVEGAEYEILGAASDETLSRIRRIHGEYHDVCPEDPTTRIGAFCQLLRTKNFEVDLLPHKRKENLGMFFARARA